MGIADEMMYEIWDGLSGNLLGTFAGEAEALAFVRRYATDPAEPEEELGLLARTVAGEATLIASGPALLQLARSVAAA